MPLILPGNVASATASTTFSVANSCRFEDGDSPMMQLTPGSSATSSRKMTISFWCKRGNLGINSRIFSAEASSGQRDSLFFSDEDKLWLFLDNGVTNLRTNRVFRDPSAWYHIVVAIDTEQGTNTNRVKFYVNGTQETSFDTGGDGVIWPDEDYDIVGYGQNGKENTIGADTDSGGNDNEWDGYLAEVVFIDGLQLAPTSFGEFNEDSPTIWQPIDVSGLTFGTNGTYLDFEASDNLGNDANGGTDWTETNLAAADQATDTPTNNFCTLNPLAPWTNSVYSEGNCIVSGAAAAWQLATGTFGVSAGKWYWEVLFVGGTNGNYHAGVMDIGAFNFGTHHAQDGVTTFYNGDAGEMFKGAADTFTTANYGTMDGSADVLGIALNVDDSQISMYKNGSAIVSDFDLDTPANLNFPLSAFHGSSQVSKFNFGGCSSFAISSAANDENGYGVFEIAPPSGYLALCTKNLGSDGG